jgi:hypothetical protein
VAARLNAIADAAAAVIRNPPLMDVKSQVPGQAPSAAAEHPEGHAVPSAAPDKQAHKLLKLIRDQIAITTDFSSLCQQRYC